MPYRLNSRICVPIFLLAFLACSPPALAKPEPDACLALGALAWDNWTAIDAGGSGLPVGETNVEYLRCKSCHGWDRLGQNGGYVRRPRTAEQPNAGFGDLDRSSRDIAPGMGDYYHVRAAGVLHEGTGRRYEDGSGSWSELNYYTATVEDKAAHAAGYTLGNQHPDFSPNGVNGNDIVLTQDQVDCLVDFINFGDADPRFYFTSVVTDAYPVVYNIHEGASARAGESFYDQNCLGCHGEPGEDGNEGRPEGGIAAFLQTDGAYSELVHKARWGVPDTIMTRAALGDPTSQDMIDVMLYLQQYVAEANPFRILTGISGTWYNDTRSGEGFLLDVSLRDVGQWEMVATFYTYDGMGNQVWLIGNAMTEGDHVTVPVQMTGGGIFGPLFDPTSVVRSDWGTLEFSFSGCWQGHVVATPNQATQDSGMGFVPVEFDITRVTPPSGCP
jgi:hypothetical protein